MKIRGEKVREEEKGGGEQRIREEISSGKEKDTRKREERVRDETKGVKKG